MGLQSCGRTTRKALLSIKERSNVLSWINELADGTGDKRTTYADPPFYASPEGLKTAILNTWPSQFCPID